MLKKMFSMMFLLVILIFAVNNSADAKQIYVGEYSDGTKAYIYDEFIKLKKESPMSQPFFQLIVDIGKGQRNALYYEFRYNQGQWSYIILQNGKSSGGESNNGSVERNIENYLETTDAFKKNFRK